jgi:ABC-type proline/glycine betaine transport system permease subunit
MTVSLLALTGCYHHREVEGGTTAYSYAWWVPIASVAAALAAIPLGILLSRKRKFAGMLLTLGAPIAAVIIIPVIATDRLTVDDRHVTYTRGFWWDRVTDDIRFDDLRAV